MAIVLVKCHRTKESTVTNITFGQIGQTYKEHLNELAYSLPGL